MTDPMQRYDSLFQCYARTLDWRDLKAQAIAESRLDPKAISHCGAEGVAQFMPATFKEIMGSADPFNPESSIQAQGIYMLKLMEHYGNDLSLALAAYNWGMGNLSRCRAAHGAAWRDYLPDETAQYLERIRVIRATLVAA